MAEVTTSEAAEMLGTDPHTVRWWCRLGRLKAKKVGNTVWLIDRRSVDTFKRLPPGPQPSVKKRKKKTPSPNGHDNGAV